MINFNPTDEDLKVIENKVENEENDFYVWDLVNEGIDAGGLLDIAKAIVDAEHKSGHWICAVIGEGDDERLVLEPLD